MGKIILNCLNKAYANTVTFILLFRVFRALLCFLKLIGLWTDVVSPGRSYGQNIRINKHAYFVVRDLLNHRTQNWFRFNSRLDLQKSLRTHCKRFPCAKDVLVWSWQGGRITVKKIQQKKIGFIFDSEVGRLVTLSISERLAYNNKLIWITTEIRTKKLTIEALGLACLTESFTALYKLDV